MVPASIGSLNATDGATVTATSAEPSGGEFATTVGGVMSGAACVEKLDVNVLTSELPAASLAVVETLTVYDVEYARPDAAVKVAVFVATL
jgi:hypothetical protein